MRGNSCRNRRRYRRNSAAECQGWNANVVHHRNQKLVRKKAGVKQSSIRQVPSESSDRKRSLIRSSRSLQRNPGEDTSSFRPFSTSRHRAWVLILRLKSKTSSLTVRPASASEGTKDNRS